MGNDSINKFLKEERLKNLGNSSAIDKILAHEERIQEVINSSSLNRLAEESRRIQEVINSSGLNRLGEESRRIQEVINSSGLNRLAEESRSIQEVINSSGLASNLRELGNITSSIGKIYSIKLDNVFSRNNYIKEIENYYQGLEDMSSESAVNFPEDKILFNSLRDIIEGIKLYFIDQAASLLNVESIDYRIWKPCLDRAISKSGDSIIVFIYILISSLIDMEEYSDGLGMVGVLFSPYMLNIELNKLIEEIKKNFYNELKNLGIDMASLK